MPDVELALREIARELDWPPEPRLAAAVGAGLRRHGRRRLGRPLVLAIAAAVAALAVAFAVPPARSAILDFFGIGGVRIERVQTLPRLSPERAAPGRRVQLAEAERSVSFRVVAPKGYSAVHLATGVVTFTWPDRLLMEFAGDEHMLKKVIAARTTVEPVDVDGSPGVWIAGAAHALYLPGGEARLAQNVLIWVSRGVTFRLEGHLARDRALALARAVAAGG